MRFKDFKIKIRKFWRLKLAPRFKYFTYRISKSAELEADSYKELNGLVIRHYKNGAVMSEINYRKGKLDGVCVSYFENGKLKSKEFYKDDKLEGLSKYYFPNGRNKSEIIYRKGREVQREDYK